MLKLTDSVYAILTKSAYVNFYLIKNEDVLTVVDIGIGNGDVDRLEREMEGQGWRMEQVQHILITHAHPDHIGGLPELQKRVQADTRVHRLDAPIVRGEQKAPRPAVDGLNVTQRLLVKMMPSALPKPSQVDVEFNGDEQLDDIAAGLQVIHLPGHSDGHCGFWFPQDRLLIGGDVMMRYPIVGLRCPILSVSPDWDAVVDSIRKTAELQVDIICLGHGKPIVGNAHAQIQKYADSLR